MELPGERDNARNNARCTQAKKARHGLDEQHQAMHGQDSPRKSQSEWQRTGINGESTSIVLLTLGSRMAEEQNGTEATESFTPCFNKKGGTKLIAVTLLSNLNRF